MVSFDDPLALSLATDQLKTLVGTFEVQTEVHLALVRVLARHQNTLAMMAHVTPITPMMKQTPKRNSSALDAGRRGLLLVTKNGPGRSNPNLTLIVVITPFVYPVAEVTLGAVSQFCGVIPLGCGVEPVTCRLADVDVIARRVTAVRTEVVHLIRRHIDEIERS